MFSHSGSLGLSGEAGDGQEVVGEAPEWVLGGQVPQKDRLPFGVNAWGGRWWCCFLEPLHLVPAGKQARPGIWHPFISVGPGGRLGA